MPNKQFWLHICQLKIWIFSRSVQGRTYLWRSFLPSVFPNVPFIFMLLLSRSGITLYIIQKYVKSSGFLIKKIILFFILIRLGGEAWSKLISSNLHHESEIISFFFNFENPTHPWGYSSDYISVKCSLIFPHWIRVAIAVAAQLGYILLLDTWSSNLSLCIFLASLLESFWKV